MDRKDQQVPGAGPLGMRLFLLSLSILFAASIVGYLVVRFRAAEWPPAGMPRLPAGLWTSTLIILLTSGAIEASLRSIRSGATGPARWGLAATWLLGAGFLVSQTLSWIGLLRLELTMQSNLYAFTFYMLTGLHAAHVVGGLAALAFVTIRAFRGVYDAGRHAGISYMRPYWHFLAAVWLVMLLLIQFNA